SSKQDLMGTPLIVEMLGDCLFVDTLPIACIWFHDLYMYAFALTTRGLGRVVIKLTDLYSSKKIDLIVFLFAVIAEVAVYL
ncbi:hypothetical protein ACJX0J_038206, partial [Zea mays]